MFRPIHTLLACLCALLLPAFAVAEEGVDVMRRVQAAMSSPGEQMQVTMQMERPGSPAEARTFSMWTRSTKDGANKALIRFETPANIARTALLTVSRTGGGQDNWLYVPALRQTRRVAAQDRSESFVQSDFTIEDLTVSVDPVKRVYSVLGVVDCGGRACLQVEDRPRDEAAGKETGYARVVLYADVERAVVHRVDFYDKAGSLLKVLQADGLAAVGDRWRFDRAVLTNVQGGSRTIMTVTRRGVGAVDDSVFNASTLDAL